MDKKNIFMGLFNYLMSVGLALVFALYLSGRIGWFFIAAFLCAPVISLVMTLLFIRNVYVETVRDTATVSKGDTSTVQVVLSNGFFLPSPPVCVEMCSSGGAKAAEAKFTCWVPPLSQESFNAEYSAVICGPHTVGVESVIIRDYFGIFSFKPKNIDLGELRSDLNILPDIADIPFTDKIFRRASDISAFSDDSEDTISDSTHRFGGFPGYDFREYIPGDPLKRISWKQSAKKGTLLVRLDDETPAQSIIIILDSVYEPNVQNQLFHSSDKLLGNSIEELKELAGQWAAESSLGLARAFVRRNYSVTYICPGEHGWETAGINDESELAEVQTELASMRYFDSQRYSRFPVEEIGSLKTGVCVFYTPYCNAALADEIALSGTEAGLSEPVIAAAVSEGLTNGEGVL